MDGINGGIGEGLLAISLVPTIVLLMILTLLDGDGILLLIRRTVLESLFAKTSIFILDE